MTVNYLKAAIAVLALICVTILLILGRMDQTGGAGIIGLIVGYATGNGVTAGLEHRDAEPIIRTKARNRRAEDEED